MQRLGNYWYCSFLSIPPTAISPTSRRVPFGEALLEEAAGAGEKGRSCVSPE
jgi:hypothetical protein